jgi:hypothetical protein
VSTQEALGELLETLIAFLARAREDARNVRMKTRLAPPISGRFLRIARRALARGLEEDGGGSGVELGIITGGKGEPADGTAAGVLIYEGARHGSLI